MSSGWLRFGGPSCAISVSSFFPTYCSAGRAADTGASAELDKDGIEIEGIESEQPPSTAHSSTVEAIRIRYTSASSGRIIDEAGRTSKRISSQGSEWRCRRLNLPLDQSQLEFGDRLCGIEPFGAGLGAVQNSVAAIEPERVFQIVEPFAGGFIA